ncbi:hypothetical protein [Bacillus sp. JCM 19034]|uniref:hypothetical protein n=1 Tax=Bacillus sp. JCM 19034 TaxID=1481928 RepID=UPI000782E4EE|nr:hypothetical protein [Bacillus sp. JCM 19034]
MEQKKQSISVRLNGKEHNVQEKTIVTDERKDTKHPFIPPQDNVIDFGEKQEVRKQSEQPFWMMAIVKRDQKYHLNEKRNHIHKVKRFRIC